MGYRFTVKFLQEADDFLTSLEKETKKKIMYNIWKSKLLNDMNLFKKLTDEIWEFRTLYNQTQYRLLAFWDNTEEVETFVIATHGFIKKSSKVPPNEIKKAKQLMKQYYISKNK